ncbi:MAG: class I SAM-dependent methyltransferase [Betaproteobacteria bacterium]|nr:class I SAM-dependent methyltransferase [Betaproteobacteria bacterium]
MFTKSKPRERSLYNLFLLNQGRDLDKWHHYFNIYERFFAPLRGRPLKILEIGVYLGGSLRMWRDYFGESAQIVGIDKNPACAEFAGEGVTIRIGHQADREFLAQVKAEAGGFDIVIDDGSHIGAHQIASFEGMALTLGSQR